MVNRIFIKYFLMLGMFVVFSGKAISSADYTNFEPLYKEAKDFLLSNEYYEEVKILEQFKPEYTTDPKYKGKVQLTEDGKLTLSFSNHDNFFESNCVEVRAALLLHEIEHIKDFREQNAVGSKFKVFWFNFKNFFSGGDAAAKTKMENRAYLKQIESLKKFGVAYVAKPTTAKQQYINDAISSVNVMGLIEGNIDLKNILLGDSHNINAYYANIINIEIPKCESDLNINNADLYSYDHANFYERYKLRKDPEIQLMLLIRESLKKRLVALNSIKEKLNELGAQQTPIDPPSNNNLPPGFPVEAVDRKPMFFKNSYGRWLGTFTNPDINFAQNWEKTSWENGTTGEPLDQATLELIKKIEPFLSGQQCQIDDNGNWVVWEPSSPPVEDSDTSDDFSMNAPKRISEPSIKSNSVKNQKTVIKSKSSGDSTKLQEQMAVAYRKYTNLVSAGKSDSAEAKKALEEYRKLQAEVNKLSGSR